MSLIDNAVIEPHSNFGIKSPCITVKAFTGNEYHYYLIDEVIYVWVPGKFAVYSETEMFELFFHINWNVVYRRWNEIIPQNTGKQ